MTYYAQRPWEEFPEHINLSDALTGFDKLCWNILRLTVCLQLAIAGSMILAVILGIINAG